MPNPEKKLMRRRIANAYLSSVISISLVLLLIGVASLIVINAGSVTKYLKENMSISVLLVDDATEEQAADYISTVGRYAFVRDTHLVTREEGARELAEMLGEDFLSVFETSPVPLSVDVRLNADYVVSDSLKFVSDALCASPLVEEIESRQSLVEALTSNIAKISSILGVFILLLLFISFALINNMVRVSVFARRFTIHTMKLVGATRSFIRAPFVRGAFVQGLIASVIASGTLWGVVSALKKSFEEVFSLFDTNSMLIATGMIFVCGVLICVLSTYFVVNKLVSAAKDDLYY